MTDAPDSIEIRSLIEAYAQAADDADGTRIAELFLPDGVVVVYRDPERPDDATRRSGQEEISHAMEGLKRYTLTSHVIANHTSTVTSDVATSTTRCIAHHLSGDGPRRRDLVMHIRYDDSLKRTSDGWRFAERRIHVLVLDERPAPTG